MNPLKILIVQIGHYGDMILITPMLRALRAVHPSVEIHLLAAERNERIIRHHPLVSRVYVYDKKPRALARLLQHLRREQYDYWIDPKDHFSREGSLLAWFGGATIKIGANRANGQVFTISVPSDASNDAAARHAVSRNLLALEALHVQQTQQGQQPLTPELFCEADAERFVEQWLQGWVRETEQSKNRPQEQLVVVNISAGDPVRHWSERGWRELLAWLNARNCAVAVNAAPADKPLAASLVEGLANSTVFPSRSIMDTVSLINRATLVVTPDTAVIHIAAAFDVPVVALFGSLQWNVVKFAPLSSRAHVLQPTGGQERLGSIEAERVIQATVDLLEEHL